MWVGEDQPIGWRSAEWIAERREYAWPLASQAVPLASQAAPRPDAPEPHAESAPAAEIPFSAPEPLEEPNGERVAEDATRWPDYASLEQTTLHQRFQLHESMSLADNRTQAP